MKSYMIFRVYTKKERPNVDVRDRSVFYGWTNIKSVVRAFLSQRNPKKYKVIKMDDEEIAEFFSEDRRDNDTRIDILILKSVATNEKIMWFTTMNETMEAEKSIQRLFVEATSLMQHANANSIELFINLNDRWAEALECIGFKPPEIDSLFNPIEYESDGSRLGLIESQIEDGYFGALEYPREDDDEIVKLDSPKGILMMNDTYSKMLYSLEAFIKVLKEDL